MRLAEELHEVTRRYRYDLDGFVRRFFPWGMGAYRQWVEPWPWHTELFDGISTEAYAKGFGVDHEGRVHRRDPILRAISSGTGTGKSTLVLPAVLFWTLSVMPQLRGIAVSASKENLTDKFFSDCLALIEASPFLGRYFRSSADGTIWVKGAKHTRSFIFRTSGSIEALSGTHSLSGCTCVLFEESGGISDDSYTATDGARSDPQVISVAVGQPTKLEGWFHRVCFGDLSELWNGFTVSLLDMPTADEALRKRKELEWGGSDTDEFRVFVLGLPRLSESNSFIARTAVEESMSRSWVDEHGRPLVPADTPLIAGLDLARGGTDGTDSNVMAFRAGKDGRIRPVSIPGHRLEPRNRADWAIQEATKPRPPYGKPALVVYDETGLDGLFREALQERGAGDLFRGVNFGWRAPAKGGRTRFKNYRAAMWHEFSLWLFSGGMLPRDDALMRTILAARAEYGDDGKLAITRKSEMASAVGRSRLDELDARLLSIHRLSVSTDQQRAKLREQHRPAGGFSIMG